MSKCVDIPECPARFLCLGGESLMRGDLSLTLNVDLDSERLGVSDHEASTTLGRTHC